MPGWPGHRAGQHVDVRLTAEDGYQAQRSYSIASAPEDDAPRAHGRAARRRRGLARTSPTSCSPATSSSCAARSAATSSGRPRSAARCCSSPAARASCRSWRCCGTTARSAATVPVRAALLGALAGRRDLPRRADAPGRRVTRRRPLHAHARAAGRLARLRTPDRQRAARGGRVAAVGRPLVYVCGPTAFVEAAAEALVALGHEPGRIRTERFGATGG